MNTSSPDGVTKLLLDWSNGSQQALDELLPLVHSELHRLAGSYLRRERVGHTLQATALVNEAYLRLIDQKRVRWKNRAHFFGIAAQLMRRVLVDYARKRLAVKRGGGGLKVTFHEVSAQVEQREIELVALDDALEALAEIDPELAKLVELRYFGGLTIEETAEVLGISPASVKREWAAARAWLYREVQGQ